jgi:hypothetical protein
MTPNTLDHWLDVATRGLCDDAKTRVRAEVEAHLAAAYDALIATGHSAELAECATLESLGGAKKARRRYARVHLTKSDERKLARLSRPTWQGVLAFGLLAAALAFIILGLPGNESGTRKVLQLEAALLFFVAVWHTLGWALASRPIVLVLGSIACEAVFPFFLFWLQLPDRAEPMSFYLVLTAFSSTWAFVRVRGPIRLFTKLRKNLKDQTSCR